MCSIQTGPREPTAVPAPGRLPGRRSVGGIVTQILLALLVAVGLGCAIPSLPAVEGLDRALVEDVNGALNGAAVGLAVGIDLVLGPLSAALLTIVVAAIVALLNRRRWPGVRAGVLVVVPWGAVEAIKLVVRRPRPEVELLAHHVVPTPESFSYPSGHTAVAAALCVAILCSLTRGSGRQGRPHRRARPARRAGRARWAGVLLGLLIVGVTAWSRVALGVHHPTDVLASAVLVPTLGLLLARLMDELPLDPLRPGARWRAGADDHRTDREYRKTGVA